MSAVLQNPMVRQEPEQSSADARAAADSDFMVTLAASLLNIRHPYEPHPDYAFHHPHASSEIAHQQDAVIKAQRDAVWADKQLTDAQRKERS